MILILSSLLILLSSITSDTLLVSLLGNSISSDFNGLLNDRQTFLNTDSSKIICAPRLFEIFDWLH